MTFYALQILHKYFCIYFKHFNQNFFNQTVSFLWIFIITTQCYPGAPQILNQCKYHLTQLWPSLFWEIPGNFVCFWHEVNILFSRSFWCHEMFYNAFNERLSDKHCSHTTSIMVLPEHDKSRVAVKFCFN